MKLNRRNLRCDGGATALLALLIRGFSRRSSKRSTLAITRAKRWPRRSSSLASARSMNCNSASAMTRFLSIGHLERRLDAAVLAQRQFLCEESVNGLDGGDLAALDAAHGDMEDFRSLS